ncbi:N-6 DNA methylase [Paracoccus mutanolyticus]|uniref:N-6 DNA methylase n=1 Tax=Paracoccus mutanolyticus TaxID=1499308 RepID=UPI0037C77D12
MRDAAGDSGEFYTPRSIVRFMVEVTDGKVPPRHSTGGWNRAARPAACLPALVMGLS